MTTSIKTKILGLTMLAIAGLSVTIPAIALAQNPQQNNPSPTYTALEPLPCVPGKTAPGQTAICQPGTMITQFDFKNYIQYIFNLAIFISAAAAVFMIVWGGFEYMTTEAWTEKGNALEKVKNAILGLLLVLTSYLILRTIDPRLVEIPTTLVEPLNITYTNTTAALINDLETSANIYLSDNIKAKEEITSLRADLATQNATQADIENQIVALAAKHGVDATVDQMCGPSGVNAQAGQEMQALCYKRVQTKVKISDDTAAIALTAGKALVAGKVSDCLASGTIDAEACAEKVNLAVNTANSRLQSMNRTVEQTQLNDYAAYANASVAITEKLKAYNPSIAINSTYALNALIPGGSIATSIDNLFIPNSKSAYGTINAIQDIVDSTNITDPKIKAQLEDQVKAIKAKIGGFGTGV